MIGDIFQPTHLLLILLVALLVLGPKRLPEAGRALGRGLRDFRGAVSGLTDDMTVEVPPAQPTAQPVPPPVAAAAPAPLASEPPTPVVDVAAPSAPAPSAAFDPTTSSIAPTIAMHAAEADPAPEFGLGGAGVVFKPPTPDASTSSRRAATGDNPLVSAAAGSASRAARAHVEPADPTEYAD